MWHNVPSVIRSNVAFYTHSYWLDRLAINHTFLSSSCQKDKWSNPVVSLKMDVTGGSGFFKLEIGTQRYNSFDRGQIRKSQCYVSATCYYITWMAYSTGKMVGKTWVVICLNIYNDNISIWKLLFIIQSLHNICICKKCMKNNAWVNFPRKTYIIYIIPPYTTPAVWRRNAHTVTRHVSISPNVLSISHHRLMSGLIKHGQVNKLICKRI